MESRIKELLSNPLIMVIDMQNVYSKGQKWECRNFDRALGKIKFLLDYSTEENVLFTRYIASEAPKGVWLDYNLLNEEVNVDSWSNEIVEELAKYEDKYKVIDKSVYSSLSVDEVKLAAESSSCVVVTGVVAECCVMSTVMNLIDLGKYVVYLKDAIAGVDDDTEKATIKVLEGLAPLHLSIMDTKEYLELRAKLIKVRKKSLEEKNEIYNEKDEFALLKNGFFLFNCAEGAGVNYHSLLYANSEEKLRQELHNTFSGSDGEVILKCSIEELKKGQHYMQGNRFGGRKIRKDVLVVHDSNIKTLFAMLDEAKLNDKTGNRLYLSDYIKKAQSIEEIEQVIDAYNDSWENYW